MKNVEIRIGNMDFCKAIYLVKPPKYPSYHINFIYCNEEYYDFKKGYYTKKEGSDHSYIYIGPNKLRRDINCSYDESCFKSPESKFAVASFDYNEHEECYELNMFRYHCFLESQFEEQRNDFWKMLEAIEASKVFADENLEPDEEVKNDC